MSHEAVLFVVTGEAPPVVTETMFSLWNDPQLRVTGGTIRVLTTQGCHARMRTALPKLVTAFNGDYGTNWKWTEDLLYVVGKESGLPLDDIASDEHQRIAANEILQHIRAIKTGQKDGEDPPILHASLAGGRRTMGVYLYQCMCWYGSEDDTLSHVALTQKFASEMARDPQLYADWGYPGPITGAADADGRPVPDRSEMARFHFSRIPFVRSPFTGPAGQVSPIFKGFVRVRIRDWRVGKTIDTNEIELTRESQPTFQYLVALSNLLLSETFRIFLLGSSAVADLASHRIVTFGKNDEIANDLRGNSALLVTDDNASFGFLIKLQNVSAAWYYFLVNYANTHEENTRTVDLSDANHFDEYKARITHTKEDPSTRGTLACNESFGNTTSTSLAFRYRFLIGLSMYRIGVNQDDAITSLSKNDLNSWDPVWTVDPVDDDAQRTSKKARVKQISQSVNKLRADFKNYLLDSIVTPFGIPKERGTMSISVAPSRFQFVE